MKTKLLLLLFFLVTLSGCASLNPWGDKDPDNRMRKSPCASLEIHNVG